MNNLLIASEFSTIKNNTLQSNKIFYKRGNKAITVATFSAATNPTEQFNTFKKYSLFFIKVL